MASSSGADCAGDVRGAARARSFGAAFRSIRIPIFFGIAALYFGFLADGWLGTAAFFVAVAAPMLATIRQRQGLALAVDYLVRVYLREVPAAMPATGMLES